MTGTKRGGILTVNSKKILQELLNNPQGLRAETISKLTGICRRTTYNNLNLLKQQKQIKNIYPIWKLCQFQGDHSQLAQSLKNNKIQLHDISFVIRLIRFPDWWTKRSNRLMKFKDYKNVSWGNNPYQQILQDKFIIQFFSNSMIFISKKKYWGNDPYDCFIEATKDFLNTYRYVEDLFKFKFFMDSVPQASIRSQHYVLLNDCVAQKCKKEGKKWAVNIDGKLRMWVDMSEPLGTEAGHKNFAPEDMRLHSNYVSDIIQNDPPKASEIAQLLRDTADLQKENAAAISIILGKMKPPETKPDLDDSHFDYIG